MDDTRIEFDHVYKKFRRGERARSLRDAVPALVGRWLGRQQELSRGEFHSLRDVDFRVRAGECVGIIGPNGAGKSTLLKCASRILRPNRGAVRVRGRVSALIEVGAGFHQDLTGRENVFLNGLILGMTRREVADRFDEIVEFSGMAEFIDTPVKRYSSGMYARLGFSVAAFMDPDVLLIDEALSVGDLGFAQKCEAKIQQIVSSDTTVLFVSHHLPAVRLICDRVLVLHAGAIVFDGPPDPAIHAYHQLFRHGENTGQSHHSIAQLSMRLVDDLGREVFSARPGDLVGLEIELVAAEPIEEAGLGFFLRGEEDSELYVCGMERLGAEPVDLGAGGRLRARFQFTANLVPGTYWIGSMVHGRAGDLVLHGRVPLDRSPNRLQLTVTGDSAASGSANLFATCETDLLPRGPWSGRAVEGAVHA